MNDVNEKFQDTLPEEISHADPDKVRKDQATHAVQVYAHILLGMVRRRHPEWSDETISDLEHAYDVVFAGLSNACAEGSLCVTVERMLGQGLVADRDLRRYIGLLQSNGLISDGYHNNIPIVFDENLEDWSHSRIYFQRYWYSERRLAEKLVALCYARPAGKLAEEKKDVLLKQLESADGAGDDISHLMMEQSNTDRCHAITQALANNFTIISGGPGTGKTTAVASVLECLLASDSQLKIALAAPTGKAAGRMLESIEHAVLAKAAVYPLLKQKQPALVAHTLHKWLIDPQSNGERPSERHPFEYDVLVIDESSMIDVELAVRTFSVIDPDRTRVILLGDPYQLAAVGPGSVLADLCDAQCPLRDYVAILTVSHRFPADSSLGRLASSIKAGDKPDDRTKPLRTVSGEIESQLRRQPLNRRFSLSLQARQWIDDHIQTYVTAVLAYRSDKKTDDQRRMLWSMVKRFQALAAMRHGPMSVASINDYAEQKLRDALKNKGFQKMSGRLVIVRKNDNSLEIYNGDVGVVLPQPESSDEPPQVYFGDRNGKMLPLGKLPEYQPAFGITIHQSQGSEYENVAVFLPDNGENPLMTRELLYTAITRVKTREEAGGRFGKLTVFGNTSAYNAALQKRTDRMGGLNARLAEARKAASGAELGQKQ